MTRGQLFAMFLPLVLLWLVGCGGTNRVPTYPVKGIILIDGKAVPEVAISLHPKNADPNATLIPSGKTNEAGEFSLGTHVGGDGAPAGEYNVTVEAPLRYNPISTRWEGDKLKGRYSDPTKSGLQVTIEKKPQELEPFKLTTSGK